MAGLYLDTGALIKLYILETGSEFVQKRAAQHGRLTLNRLQEMELRNGILAAGGRGVISEPSARKTLAHFREDLQAGLFWWEDTDWESLWERSGQLAERFTSRFLCRTLDILHVAAAEQSGAEFFLTGDGRQERLAKAVGLPVIRIPLPTKSSR